MKSLSKRAMSAVPRAVKKWIRKRVILPHVPDLRHVTDDPVEALYLAPNGAPLIDVPLAACRGLYFVGFDCSAGSAHPYIRTLIAYGAGRCPAYEGSPLERYFDAFAPRSAAEVLGLEAGAARATESDQTLSRMPATQAVCPWWTSVAGYTPADIEAQLLKGTVKENRAAGSVLPAGEGVNWYGPVTARKGAVEFGRLTRLFDRVKAEGYRRDNGHDGDIVGQVLRRGGDGFAVFLTSGQHRVAAASALGLATVPVRLNATLSAVRVERGDVDAWPHVRSGLFGREQALAVFDRLYEGRPSATP